MVIFATKGLIPHLIFVNEKLQRYFTLMSQRIIISLWSLQKRSGIKNHSLMRTLHFTSKTLLDIDINWFLCMMLMFTLSCLQRHWVCTSIGTMTPIMIIWSWFLKIHTQRLKSLIKGL